MSITTVLDKKINDTVEHIKSSGSVVVAFSGGVDSSLLLHLSLLAKVKYLAVTFHSYLYDESEINQITNYVRKNSIEHKVIHTDPLTQIDELRKNPKERCYVCKKYLYGELIKLKTELVFDAILDGSNFDDLKSYRPGRQAVKEAEILSPLATFEFTKNEVRQAAEYFGLEVYNKPSLSCFLTRYEYGVEINKEMIKKVNEAESFLASLRLHSGRCRVHSRDILRLEFNDADLIKAVTEFRAMIIEKMKFLQFKYITLDIEGYITGSMDK